MVLGKITNIELEWSEKDGNFKFNSDPTKGIELKDITIFVGVNGSGKSLIMKLTWLCNFIMFSRLNVKKESEKDYVEHPEFMLMSFSKTFKNSEDLNCKCKAKFDCGSTLSFHVKDSKTLEYDIDIAKNVDQGIMPVYLSSATRLFSSVEEHISFKKDLLRYIKDENEIARKIMDKYILPDLLYLEMRASQLQNGISVPEEVSENLVKNYDFPYKPLLFYLEDDKIHLRTDVGVKKISSLGAGHQSLLTMLLPV